jgi:hypothetical protein
MAEWQPIETAPKDGTEILGWREDCDVILIRFTSMDDFMNEGEIKAEERIIGRVYSDDDLSCEGWFYADFVRGGRLADDEAPTHWMPLPPPPSEQEG